MKAYLKNYRQSPRKVRLVADMIRGKDAQRALAELKFLPKRASEVVSKLLASAISNAENNFKVSASDLVVKEVSVDKGPTLRRFRPRARGSASRINKRTSNVRLVLEQKK
ncbi:50S ribosomal protein L22 [Candidatus Nomurabacteria bacterium]|nr:50S ribosomal protein L22 [Candidatus Nomurabacteria bacterium]